MNVSRQNETRFTIGVFAILLDECQRVLLCHRRDFDLWNLPGGGLEASESPWIGVVREVREEVGLDVVVERLSGVYSKPESDEIVFAFLCRAVGGALTLTVEADQIAYFALNEFPANTSRKQLERVSDVLDALRTGMLTPTLKEQYGPSSRTLAGQG